MMDKLESIDRWIVFTVNGWHTPLLDELFWYISSRAVWIPLYLLLIFLSWRRFGTKKTLIFVGIVLGTIALVDLSSVYLFKETFQRFRPSHHALLTNKLHFYRMGFDKETGKIPQYYKGGDFGFISSHASNFFAVATIVGLSLKKWYPKLIWILLGISVIVCFSRLYLGVHYLSDLVCGAFWGVLIAYLSYRLLVKRFLLNDKL